MHRTDEQTDKYGKISIEPVRGKPTIWVPSRSDTNRAVPSQKKARSLKIRIQEEEGFYYACSENKGADLRLCFRLCRFLVFPYSGSIGMLFSHNLLSDTLISLLILQSALRKHIYIPTGL